jgi:hypothetical protein
MSLKNNVEKVMCRDWDRFVGEIGRITTGEEKELKDKEWIFRGALESKDLETTLERACGRWGIPAQDRPALERELIREVERKAFGLGIPLPHSVDRMWWVSLMQHYGAPTRLLDFSYSPYVAAYFAFERLFQSDRADEQACVWAIQHRFLWDRLREAIEDPDRLHRIERSRPGSLDFLFDPENPMKPFVMHVNAYYLHDRITVQQGVFLCPTNLSFSFEENFRGNSRTGDLVKRLVLPREVMRSGYFELRKLNITTHSLFPGFGGLAESLTSRLPQFHDLVKDRRERGV